VGPLKNPHNGIARVGHALSEVGFTVLDPLKDASRDDMLFGVYKLAERLRNAGPGAVGFLYYKGHGIAVGGENVLIPKNVESTSDAELSVRGVRLSEVLDILKSNAPDAVHFVVPDACRNNIWGQKGAKGYRARCCRTSLESTEYPRLGGPHPGRLGRCRRLRLGLVVSRVCPHQSVSPIAAHLTCDPGHPAEVREVIV
jgi:hypothetical protein